MSWSFTSFAAKSGTKLWFRFDMVPCRKMATGPSGLSAPCGTVSVPGNLRPEGLTTLNSMSSGTDAGTTTAGAPRLLICRNAMYARD